MKKALCIACVIGFMATLVSPVTADDSFKFGFVDVQKVIFTSITGKAAIQKVKGFQEKRQSEITVIENTLNTLEKDLTKQLFSLTEEAIAVKKEDIRKKKMELKRLLEDSEYELDKRKKELLESVNRDIVAIIQKMGKDEGYHLILEVTGSNVIYADLGKDLTDKIITMYDKSN